MLRFCFTIGDLERGKKHGEKNEGRMLPTVVQLDCQPRAVTYPLYELVRGV